MASNGQITSEFSRLFTADEVIAGIDLSSTDFQS